MVQKPRIIKPNPKQALMLSCAADEIAYMGGRGSGKSIGIILDWIMHERRYKQNASGLILRRTFPELEDFLAECQRIMPSFGHTYKISEKIWQAKSGAQLKMGYLENKQDADRYQGRNLNWLAFDEAGLWGDPEPLDKIKASVRSAAGVKTRIIYTGNPGGPGHQWIKSRFVDPVPPFQINTIKSDQADGYPITRVYIHATVDDNKELLKNDPAYLDRLRQIGGDALWKAWRYGDWNIVAGAFFADVWSAANVLEPFEMPGTWHFTRGFDWGSSKPFATIWAAQANGEQPVNGPYIPKGSWVVFAEDYGWNGKPNEGLRTSVAEVSRRIKTAEKSWSFKVTPGPADSAIFAMENGQSIIADFRREGIDWTESLKGPGSRAAGWQKLRDLLRAAGSKEEPGLYIFSTCRHLIRTLPNVPRDEKKWDDIDTDSEDHLLDSLRYLVATPRREVKPVKAVWG